MTTYNTRNPVGSTAVKDLFDNAENLDRLVNDQTVDVWDDRLGRPRKTWQGIENQAQLDIAEAVEAGTQAAESYRDESERARDAAELARDNAVAAAGAIGPLEFYDTYAQALGDIANLADSDLIEVSRDETKKGARTRYRVEAGALVFVANLDQLRDDLAEPTKGLTLIEYLAAVTGAEARSAAEKLGEVISLFDVIPKSQHAAIRARTSVYNAQPKIQALIDDLSAKGVAATIIGNTGKFFCANTVSLKSPVSLIGATKEFSLSFNDISKDGFVIGGGDTRERRRTVMNMMVEGLCKDMFVCAPFPSSNTSGLHLDIENIEVYPTGGVNGFTFANMYGSSFRNLFGFGDVTNAKFNIISTVNGVSFDNLYTTGTHLHSIYYDVIGGPAGLPSASTVMFNSPVLQGGNYGFSILGAKGLVINNPYFENVANNFNIVTGDGRAIAGLVINGGTYSTASTNNPYYASRGPAFRIGGVTGMQVNSPAFFDAPSYLPVSVSAGDGVVYMLLNKNGTPAAYVIAFCGQGYATAPTLTAPNPVSGTKDTLTATISGGKIVSVNVVPGSNPVYGPNPGHFPVIVLVTKTVSGVKFSAPSVRVGFGAIPFHPFIGRDAGASSTAGILVDGDREPTYAGTINTGKTTAYAWNQYHSFVDGNGVPQTWTSVLPLIAAQ